MTKHEWVDMPFKPSRMHQRRYVTHGHRRCLKCGLNYTKRLERSKCLGVRHHIAVGDYWSSHG